jgi:catechol 2,3-dioxygenase-like lactoylglutathione lyase family enzyme
MVSQPAVSFGDVNVVCVDLKRSLAFYRDALGLREVDRDGGAVRLGIGDATVLLLPFATRARPSDAYPEEATISFDVVVDDLEATVSQLEEAGGVRVTKLDEGWGWAVRDPDGNVIEVIQRA